jgi:hypothetical protein
MTRCAAPAPRAEILRPHALGRGAFRDFPLSVTVFETESSDPRTSIRITQFGPSRSDRGNAENPSLMEDRRARIVRRSHHITGIGP